jgi:hypothetical protein
MKCKFCKVELVGKNTCTPFSMNDIMGGEKMPVDSYLHCPKCGLMYQHVEVVEEEIDENIWRSLPEPDFSSQGDIF